MTGWHEPLELDNFENVLRAVEPTIIFMCRNSEGKIKGYDSDDLYQEFSIKLWDMLSRGKIPPDMVTCDYRFRRYLQKALFIHVAQLHRGRQRRTGPNQRVRTFRDMADFAVPLSSFDLDLHESLEF